MTRVSCMVWWQPLQYFHHLLPHYASVRLAMSKSFQTTKQSTPTIFMSCFHTGTQTFSFWPHAYFSFKSPVQHLVALPAPTALFPASPCPTLTENHPMPSSKNGHMLQVHLSSASDASAFSQHYFYRSSQNLVHFLCHHSSSSLAEEETSLHCKAMTAHYWPFLSFSQHALRLLESCTLISYIFFSSQATKYSFSSISAFHTRRWQPQDRPKRSDIFQDPFFHLSDGPHHHQERSPSFPPSILCVCPSRSHFPALWQRLSAHREPHRQGIHEIITCPSVLAISESNFLNQKSVQRWEQTTSTCRWFNLLFSPPAQQLRPQNAFGSSQRNHSQSASFPHFFLL